MRFNPLGKFTGLSITSPQKAASSIIVTLFGIFTVSNKGHQDAREAGIVLICSGNCIIFNAGHIEKILSPNSMTVLGSIASIRSHPKKAASLICSKPLGKFTSTTLVL